MSKRPEADKIIRRHVLWSMGAGLMPVPLFDIAAVTAVQIDMLRQLADLYEVDHSQSSGKAFVAALTGGTFARIGASAVKVVPVVGTVVGGVSMSIMSGASTYAVGQVAISHFGSKAGLLDVDMSWAREAYDEAFRRGKEFVSGLEGQWKGSRDIYQALDRLGELRDKGVITEEDFQEQKRKLLDRV